MLNIGILGCGRIGQVHGLSLLRIPNANVVAVSDMMPQAANSLAEKLNAKVMDSDAIIADNSIDAVIIGTPTDTHYDLIHKAAAAKKAIFCEKPVDMSTQRIRDCLKIVDANGVQFLTAFNRRFDPNFATLEKQLREGSVGNIELITILSRDPAPPPISYIKSSGGIFRDMMIHDFDMARFLLAEEPVELYATGSCLVDPEIGNAGDIDTASVTLKTASGKICQITNSRRASYGYDQRIEVHGSKGLIRADNILENQVEIANENGFCRAPTQAFFLERYAEAYLAEMIHFIECVEQKTQPKPNGIDGLKAQTMADMAAQSLADKQVKQLNLD